jgi:hypothetical protein
LCRTVERYQVEVTDHCPSLGERPAADSSCSPQDLDSGQLAGDDGPAGGRRPTNALAGHPDVYGPTSTDHDDLTGDGQCQQEGSQNSNEGVSRQPTGLIAGANIAQG